MFRLVLYRLWGMLLGFLGAYLPLDKYQMRASKCVFCGAPTGIESGTYLHEHRPRCRFIGPANVLFWQRPNYFKMIEEDDEHYLPMMHAEADQPKLKKENTELREKVFLLEAKLALKEKKPESKYNLS
jgi:hypothetical protein